MLELRPIWDGKSIGMLYCLGLNTEYIEMYRLQSEQHMII